MEKCNYWYSEFLNGIRQDILFPDEDQEDEEYNVIEDLINNNRDYKYDNVPYNHFIAKKEIEDINKSNTYPVNNSFLSQIDIDKDNKLTFDTINNNIYTEKDNTTIEESNDCNKKNEHINEVNKTHEIKTNKKNIVISKNNNFNFNNSTDSSNSKNSLKIIEKNIRIENNNFNINSNLDNSVKNSHKNQDNLCKNTVIENNTINDLSNKNNCKYLYKKINCRTNSKEFIKDNNESINTNKNVDFIYKNNNKYINIKPNKSYNVSNIKENNNFLKFSNNLNKNINNQQIFQIDLNKDFNNQLIDNYKYIPTNYNIENKNVLYNQNSIWQLDNFNQTCYQIKLAQPITELPELIRICIKQYDFYLQLIFQNAMMTNDKNIKYRCMSLLGEFYNLKEQTIFFLNLPRIDFYSNSLEIINKGRCLKIAPQMSFSQAPILEIAPLFENIILNSSNFSVESISKLFEEILPFVNMYYIPFTKKKNKNLSMQSDNLNESFSLSNILEKSENVSDIKKTSINNNNYDKEDKDNYVINSLSNDINNKSFLRKKRPTFDKLHDNLLAIGIHTFGKKNIEAIQKYFLETKTNQEIKHRIKNLTCKKASDNIIKKIKQNQEFPMNSKEFVLFLKGIQWFGVNKWTLISRYFIPERNAEYLENIYKLLISLNYLEDYEIKKYQSRLSKKNNINNKIRYKELDYFQKKIDDLAKEHKYLIDKTNLINSGENCEKYNRLMNTMVTQYEKIFLDDVDDNNESTKDLNICDDYFDNKYPIQIDDSKEKNMVLNIKSTDPNNNSSSYNNFKNCIKRRYGSCKVIFLNDNIDCYERINLDK